MRLSWRGRGIIVLLLSAGSLLLFGASLELQAQVYPRWFIEQGDLQFRSAAVGYANPSFYQDSSASQAFSNAYKNLVMQSYTKLSGGESFWETEAGVYWMGNDYSEDVDSSRLTGIPSNVKRVDIFFGKGIVISLAADGDSLLADSMKVPVSFPKSAPSWVESLPEKPGYIYAIGISPNYFYESSSWETAEKMARRNLGFNIRVSAQALQKIDENSGQEIRNEEISVELRHFQIAERWKDNSKNLYYVLARMPAQ